VFEKEKSDLEKKLPPSLVSLTEQVNQAAQFQQHVIDYKENVSKAKVVHDQVELRKRWQQFVVKAADQYAKAEAELSKAKLNQIETEYTEMFAYIMNADDVVPSLQRNDTSENLFVELSDFHGQHDLSAKALLSESFKNALAISVYLSAALKHTAASQFLVLDDITSSFDAWHQLRLVDYIIRKLQYSANPNGLQFIILTHDEMLKSFLEHLSSDGKIRHYVLSGAPPSNLILRGESAAKIRSNAEVPLLAGQADVGEKWVRPYLECILMEIIRKVKIYVPLEFAVKAQNRMVGNCIDAIKKAVDTQIALGNIILSQQQFQDIQSTHLVALLSNWVSHYETAGSGGGGSASVLLGVLDSVDQLADCFKYDYTDTRGVVTRRYYKSLTRR